MKRKVTLKVFTPLLHEFESQLEIIHMKRDLFINHLIDCELPYLETDLHGKRLSTSAKRFMSRSLKRLGASQINVQLNSATAARLDEIADGTNLVRDSFINRLLYLSLGSDSLLRFFEVRPDHIGLHPRSLPMGYLHAMHEIQADPLGDLRRLVKAKYGFGLYLAQLPVELAAFECYLDDETFWDKYSIASNEQDTANDVLRSFESTIYQAQLGPVQGWV